MQIDFPFRLGSRGRTALTTEEEHVRDLIEQVLFTSPGERVNRPGFGSGLLQSAFGPNSDVMATAVQFSVQGALQQWLGDRIQMEAVDVESHPESGSENVTEGNSGATLSVTVRYRLLRDGQLRTAQLSREI